MWKNPTRIPIRMTMAALLAALLAGPALADRAPTADERAGIERVLQAEGFVSWKEIELDDDGPYWEVDDARTANPADGAYDLKLEPGTLKIIARELDD